MGGVDSSCPAITPPAIQKILARIKEVSAKSAYSRDAFLKEDMERAALSHRMSKYQDKMAVSTSANRAASARVQAAT